MTKSELGEFLIAKGYIRTAHGHFIKGEHGKRTRYKLQANSLRVERESIIPSYDGKPQSFWTRIGGGYYKDISLNPTDNKLRVEKNN
ncbi:MAG: hypothetical protein LBS65_05175 [Desulfovibrio sp.]|jgi:hypothetical protein|nr:hypothetical protein [Desulfovibrio sp.]